TGNTKDGTVTTLTNTYSVEKTEATVRKVWDDDNDADGKRPASLTVTLSNGESVTLNKANGWMATVKDLPKFENGEEIAYTWTEPTLPEGYKLTSTAKNGTVTTLTNSYTPEKTEASVKKVWNDENNAAGKRPASLTVTLSNGERVTLNESNGWTAKVENLPKYENGKEIAYTWTEDKLPEGYELTGNTKDGTVTTLTNTYSVEKTEATVRKVWDDDNNADGKRPASLTVTLSNGTTVTLNEANGWMATVKDLPKFENGEEIAYTWTEATLPEGYTLTSTTKEGTITTLTNTHTPETTEATVRKVWEDNNNAAGKRPESLTVVLSNGDAVTLNEANGWTATVKDLPKYRNGNEIVYTWKEGRMPEGYTMTSNTTEGTITTITNSMQAGNLRVEKTFIVRDASGNAIYSPTQRVDKMDANAKSQFNGLQLTIYGPGGFEENLTYAQLPYEARNVVPGRYIVVEKNAVGLLTGYTMEVGSSTMAASGDVLDQEWVTITLTNVYTADTGSLEIIKDWSFDPALTDEELIAKMNELTFTIEGPSFEEPMTVTYSEFTNGRYLLSDLMPGTYTVTETNAEGLFAETYVWTGGTTTATAEVAANGTGRANLRNTYAKEAGSITLTKTWSENVADLEELNDLIFLITGVTDPSFRQIVTYAEFTGGAYTMTVPVGTYNVKEINHNTILNDYTWESGTAAVSGIEVTANAEATAAFENNYKENEGQLVIIKSFIGIDNPDEVAGDISSLSFTIEGPSFEAPMTVSYGEFVNGRYTLSDLLPGTYTVTEKNAEGLLTRWNYTFDAASSATDGYAYVTEESGNGMPAVIRLINKYDREDDEKGGLRIRKTINGGDNVDFSNLTFQILGPNGYEETVTYAQFTNGVLTRTGLEPGTYTVYETNAAGISMQLTLLGSSVTAVRAAVAAGQTTEANLINDYDQPLTSVVVMKVWEDMDNLDGTRPGSITMRLNNGMFVVLSDANNWMAQITDLPLYNGNGTVAQYSWTEEAVEGYTMTGVRTLGNTTVFTNTHVPQVTRTSVTKIWDDNNNEANLRPATLRVRLSNGQTYTLSDANNWTVTVENLPVTYAGVPVTYTWTEQTVLGYTSEVRVVDDVTIFTNHYRVITPPSPPYNPGKPRTPVYVFEEYPTPLGIEVMINHVGDCFE
ncbi:MAG: Cna B-type domain-containing protein, partial [Clostridia bacterium]|nr:Cna B-type domain-containing protein [Clostridia bacterium]